MRTLIVIAVTFFTIFGALIAYVSSVGPGHEYDLNFRVAIDTRHMPKAVIPPVVAQGDGEGVPEVRVESLQQVDVTSRAPIHFESRQPNPNEARIGE